MPYKMKAQVAQKIFHKALNALRDSSPEYAKKHAKEPKEILDEYLADYGTSQFLEDLTSDKEIIEEIGKLLAYWIDLDEWPDMMNGHGHIIASSQEKLIEWTLDSVIYALKENPSLVS